MFKDAYRDLPVSFLQTMRKAFDLSGRSHRFEVLYYLIGATILRAIMALLMPRPEQVANATDATLVPYFEEFLLASFLLNITLFLPLPALFVRRLHDQGRSIWPSMLAGAFVALVFARFFFDASYVIDSPPAGPMRAFNLAVALFSAGLFVLFWLPGDNNENEFGPNPRLAD